MRNPVPFRRRAVSLTPLIDVVFLLLLFFMLTSTFSTFGEIELNRPAGGQAGTETPTERFFIQLGTDQLALNGTPVEMTAIGDQLEDGLVLIDLDEAVTSQRLVDLLAVLRGRDGLDVLVLE